MPRSLISITEARRRVLDAATPLATEPVALDDALGRVLAQDVAGGRRRAPVPVLGDGRLRRARRGRRAHAADRRRVPRRHSRPATRLAEGEAIRISTGAAIPPGATAVIPQENVDARRRRRRSTPTPPSPPGEHIRGAGEDMRARTIVLSAGHAAGPGGARRGGRRRAWARSSSPAARGCRCCAPATSCGPRASRSGPGEIHNSNAPMLTGLARRAGAVTAPAQPAPR